MIFFSRIFKGLDKILIFSTQGRGQEKLKFWIKVYQGLTLINLEVQGKFEVNFFKVKVYPSRVNIQFLFKVFSRVTLEIPQNSRQLQGGHFREFCNLQSRFHFKLSRSCLPLSFESSILIEKVLGLIYQRLDFIYHGLIQFQI